MNKKMIKSGSHNTALYFIRLNFPSVKVAVHTNMLCAATLSCRKHTSLIASPVCAACHSCELFHVSRISSRLVWLMCTHHALGLDKCSATLAFFTILFYSFICILCILISSLSVPVLKVTNDFVPSPSTAPRWRKLNDIINQWRKRETVQQNLKKRFYQLHGLSFLNRLKT